MYTEAIVLTTAVLACLAVCIGFAFCLASLCHKRKFGWAIALFIIFIYGLALLLAWSGGN